MDNAVTVTSNETSNCFFVYPLIQKTAMIIRMVIVTMLNGKYPDNSAAVMP